METTLAQERREIEEDPEHEIEELALLYQLKGFAPEESARIAETIAQDKEKFLRTMVQENRSRKRRAGPGSPRCSAGYPRWWAA